MNITSHENLPSYKIYYLSKFEYLLYGLGYEFVLFVFSYCFYDNYFLVIVGNLFIKKYFNMVSTKLKIKRNENILCQFIDMLTAISASLNTGYSIENSIIESLNTMKTMHGEQSIICTELKLMERKLLLNIPIESIFEDLGNRTGIEEIINFCEILKIAKKTGGNLISIIRTTSEHFREKYNIKSDINVSIAARKYEQIIMFIMPIFIFIYINLTQPGFFAPLYHNILGIIISSICLSIYFLSLLLTKKILSIEV